MPIVCCRAHKIVIFLVDGWILQNWHWFKHFLEATKEKEKEDSILKIMPIIEPMPLNVVAKVIWRSVCIEPFDHSRTQEGERVLLIKKTLYKCWGCLRDIMGLKSFYPKIRTKPGGSLLWLRMWVFLVLLVSDTDRNKLHMQNELFFFKLHVAR